MFKAIARLEAGRRHLPGLTPAYHNDNRRNRNRPDVCPPAAAARNAPTRLASHWQVGPSGRLECHWVAEPVEEIEEPQLCVTQRAAPLAQAAGNAVERGFANGRAA